MDYFETSNQSELNTNYSQAESHTLDNIWDRLFYMGLLAEKYYTPLLCFVGILGNFISLLVFLMNSNYRRQSSSYYLTALSLSDTGFLISLFVVWFETTFGGVLTSAFICPLVMYLGQVTCFVTVYITVAFSVQRYIVVYYPFSRMKYCTKGKAKITICGIVGLGLITFSYVWIIAEVVEIQFSTGYQDVCSVSERYYNVSEIATYIDSIITLIIPFFIIAYFNLKTASKVCDFRKQRYRMLATSIVSKIASVNKRGNEISGSETFRRKYQYGIADCMQINTLPLALTYTIRVTTEDGWNVSRNSKKQRIETSDTHVTKTLLLVSSVFLVLNLPLHVLRCTQFIQIVRGTNVGMEILLGLQPWANMLFNTNFAVNMVLYCVFGRNFRNSLRNVLRRLKRK